jgi:hypothetical protein
MNEPVSSRPRTNLSGLAVALVVALGATFALGVVIGYNSVYRNVSVAMLAPPAPSAL